MTSSPKSRRPNDDGGRLAGCALDENIVIERVQRLAPFEHDVVGHIDNVADRPHTRVSQPVLHPAWRRAYLHAFQQHGSVPRRQVRILNLDFDATFDRLAERLHRVRRIA